MRYARDSSNHQLRQALVDLRRYIDAHLGGGVANGVATAGQWLLEAPEANEIWRRIWAEFSYDQEGNMMKYEVRI